MKREEYLSEWKKLAPLIVTMTRKDGLCNHELGDVFRFKNPYDKPQGICSALWHVISFYGWRVEMGFPSWEPDDENTYRLHCPCETGTVWELRKGTSQECEQYADARKSAAGNQDKPVI